MVPRQFSIRAWVSSLAGGGGGHWCVCGGGGGARALGAVFYGTGNGPSHQERSYIVEIRNTDIVSFL